MYSDGITEAEDAAERPFDEAGLQAVVDGTAGRRRRNWGGLRSKRSSGMSRVRRLRDDLTVLIVRRLPPLPVRLPPLPILQV